MTGSRTLIRSVVCLLGVCVLSASGDSSAHPRANFKGSPFQTQPNGESRHQALESAPVSEVDYVDGPLAPLYDFLIQHKLQRFCKLLRDSQLEQVIRDLGDSWTLFAPTDASFIFLPGGTLEELQRNPQLLTDFILYHFVVGDFPSTQIQNELMVNSAQGSPLRFNTYGQTMTVSGAEILEPDLLFEMGRVYIVDRPLYPIPSEDIMTYLQRTHKEMYRFIIDLGLADYISSGTFTLLAPEDEAFDYLSVELKDALATNISLAERVLMNHILPGSVYIGGITDGMQWPTVSENTITFTIKRGLVFVEGIPIILPDVPLTNGVIHVLNRVLLPEGIDADCQCKPSRDTSQTPGQVSGGSRPPFGQTQRPPFGQGTTTRPGQSASRQTPRPPVGQTPGTSGVSGQTNPQGRPQGPSTSPGQPGNRPWSPSRTGQPARPPSPPSRSTQPPHITHEVESLPDDDINSVIGTGVQPGEVQGRPWQTRTTRYPSPPTPRQRLTPRPPSPGVSSQRPVQEGAYPGPENENYPEQEVTSVTHTTRQTDRWPNRQRTPTPRYPTPQRGSYQTPTTRRPQTTRSHDWNQPRVTQPSFEQPDQGIDSTTQIQDQGLKTPRPGSQTTSWQQRKQVTQTTSWQQRNQITQTTRQPTQRATIQPVRPQPPQRRTTVRPSGGRTTVQPQVPPNEQPVDPNRQQPNCRRLGERVTPFTRNLPVCSESDLDNCQNSPYDATDPRPLCPESVRPDCRQPNEPYDLNKPLCETPAPEECREFGEPTYIGDRRPLCTTSTSPSQTGCKDPSTPYNPSDRRPLCRTTSAPAIAPPSAESDNAPQGCRRPDEVANPSDQRPLCPEEPQQDCRPFLERPKPGDRRPVCKNRQPAQRPKPIKESDKPQKKPEKPQEQTTYPQRGQYPTQTTRRQSWQSTTRAPQSWQSTTTTAPQSWQSTTRAPQSWQSTTRSPQSWQSTARASQSWQSTTRAPQSWQSTTRAPQSWQSTTRAPQSWQSTTRAPQSWQTTRQPIGKQPQSNPGSGGYPGVNPSEPQTGYDVQPQPVINPQSQAPGTHPSRPQSGRYPTQPQPQGGRHPSQPQSGTHTSQPQSDTHPSQPQTGADPSQSQPSQPAAPQSGSYPGRVSPSTGPHSSQPQSGRYPSQQPGSPQSGSYPSQPQSGAYPSQQPGSPQSGSYPSQPQSGAYPSQQPGSPQSGSYPSQPSSGVHPSSPQPGSSRPFQPTSGRGQPQQTRPTPSYPQRRPGFTQTQSTPSSLPQTPGVSQPGSADVRPNQPFNRQQPRPVSGQGHQTGSFATSPPRRPTIGTTRVPVSLPGTSTTPGEDSRRSLYEIVEDPALLIRGRPVQLTKIFDLFHKAGIEDVLTGPGPTTVFLPSDDAFALLPRGVVEQLEENPELLRQILLYHVTNSEILPSAQPNSYTVPSLEGNRLVITMLNSGRLIFVSGAKAVAVTIANNGIFYVINQLLYPLPHHDIVGAIQSRPDLSTLAYLLPLSGLEDMLRGQTPYTLLAPTDNAFAQLPQAVYEELTRNTTALQEILLNHIIEGAHYGREFFVGGTFPSARGGKLKFQVVSYGYQVNEVNIKTPEIVTGSGVIHLIDQVLLEDPDLQFITGIENSVTGEDGTDLNTQQPGGAAGQPGVGPISPRFPSNQRPGSRPVLQPQIGGLQPAVGQPAPVGRIPAQGQGNQPTSPGQPQRPSFGGQRQPDGQPAHGQQTPGQSPGSPSFGGRQPVHGQQNPGQSPGSPSFGGHQPVHGQQTPGQSPGSPSFGGRQPAHGQQTPGQSPGSPSFGGRQPVHGQQTPGQSPGSPSFGGRQPVHGQQTPGQSPGSPSFGGHQPAHGQQTPGQSPGSPSFGGRQPTTQGVRQPTPGRFQTPRQPSTQQPGHNTQQTPGQQTPAHGQRTQTGTFINQRQPVSTQTGGQPTSPGVNQGQGPFQTGGQPNDVADLARSMGLNKFANWITNTGLLEKIHDGGVYTVFAPTDDAVSSLPQDMVYSIESNPEQVKPVLQYHIVPQRLNLNSVTNEETASTLLQGKNIRFNVYSSSQPDCRQLVTASGTPVGEALATMGSIQLIPVTQVLYQPAGNLLKIIEASPILQRLNEAVKSARLTWVLSGNGPMTIFAPSDTAFEALTEEQKKTLIEDKQAFSDLLKRHIVRGTYFSSGIQDDLDKKSENNKPINLSLQEGILTVNSVPVTYSDITATNGVLHVVDRFL